MLKFLKFSFLISAVALILVVNSCGTDKEPDPVPPVIEEPKTPPTEDPVPEETTPEEPNEPEEPEELEVTCELDETANGYIKDCSDGYSYFKFITETEETPIIEEIDPCGDELNEFDELLFRLEDGRVILSYMHKKKEDVFFKEKDAGVFTTDDIQACPYEVTEDGDVLLDIEEVKYKKKKHKRWKK